MVENQSNRVEQDIWSLYLYALKSPVTREKYQKRLEKFFDFLGLEGTLFWRSLQPFIRVVDKGQENFSNIMCS